MRVSLLGSKGGCSLSPSVDLVRGSWVRVNEIMVSLEQPLGWSECTVLEVVAEGEVVLEHHKEACWCDYRVKLFYLDIRVRHVLAQERVVADSESAHNEVVNWSDDELRDVDGWESGWVSGDRTDDWKVKENGRHCGRSQVNS